MEIVTQLIHNKFIWVPFFTWIAIQTFKVIWDLITTKKFNFKRIMGAGRNAKFSFSCCHGNYCFSW